MDEIPVRGGAHQGSTVVKGEGGWHRRGYLPHFDTDTIPQSVTFHLADSIPAALLAAWRDELAQVSTPGSASIIPGSAGVSPVPVVPGSAGISPVPVVPGSAGVPPVPVSVAPDDPPVPIVPGSAGVPPVSALPNAGTGETPALPGPALDHARILRRRIEAYLDRGEGQAWLRDPRIAGLVQDALRHFDGTRYHLHAWAVMPNHIHALLTLTTGGDLSAVVHSWKSYTAKAANRALGRTGTFWQADYFDRGIRDQRHFAAVVSYIEENPVKAGLCATSDAWPYSSRGYDAHWRTVDMPVDKNG